MINPRPLPSHGNRQWSVTTAPAKEPISFKELKEFARIDGSYEDGMLSGFITAVRDAAEKWLGRALISQTITMAMDYWPGNEVALPRPPLISVTQVRTLDEDNTVTEYAASNYMVITNSTPGKVVLKFSVTPPDNTDRYHSGYEIEFVAGYGTDADDVPQAIREGIKLWAANLYETRTLTTEPPPEALALLMPYKVIRI